MVGCKHASTRSNKLQLNPLRRSAKTRPTRDTVVTIGVKTTIGNTESLVGRSGVGLVYQLPGTGSSPPPGGWRTMLEDNLKKLKRDQAINDRNVPRQPVADDVARHRLGRSSRPGRGRTK